MTTSSIAFNLSPPWRRALMLAALLILTIGWAYRDTAAQMVGIWWRSNTFAHAFLVLPISLWLAWRQRARLARLTPRTDVRVLVPMLAAAGLWFAADITFVNAATQFAFVALLALSIPAVFGLQVARALTFPLLFLFFSVPFGEFMLEPMMDWTADFVVRALQLTGVPVYREGLRFVIPTGNWSVIDECSGVRYLIASFMVGSLFAYLNYQSPWRRFVFMVVSLLVPVVANWLRAYIIVMMGHLSGNKLAVGVDHLLYGWVFFGVVIFIMFSIGMRWSEPEPDPAAGAEVALNDAGGAQARAHPQRATASVLAMIAVALLPHLAGYLLERRERAAADPRLELPDQVGVWRVVSEGELVPGWKPNFPTASLLVRRTYTDGRQSFGVLVAYYRKQGPDRKLVSSVNGVLQINDRQWTRVSQTRRTVNVDGRGIDFVAHDMLGPEGRMAGSRMNLHAWQTYWIDGHHLTSDARAKLAGALQRVQGHGDDGAIVVLYAVGDNRRPELDALERFAQSALPALDRALQQTQDAR